MIDDSKPKDPVSAGAPAPSQSAPPAPSSAAAPATQKSVSAGSALEKEPLAPVCSIDDFSKVDLRVARIVSAEAVPEAKKLLKLTVSLGGDVTRTVFAGIKAYYKPEDLVGRLVIVCANLAPRQMRLPSGSPGKPCELGLSEGMVLAAGADGEAYLLTPDAGAQPGQRVH